MPSSRIILHLDFNSFFASIEQQANPFLRGKAIAVAGKGRHSIDVSSAHKGQARIRIDQLREQRSVVTTASREAKALGVKTAMGTWEARKICPELLVIPGDPKKYGEITKRFFNILTRYADAVELASTDEAFADITVAAEDYFGATLIAQRIRRDIAQQCGEYATVSIGIANNKLLAKLASESVKPNGLTVVPPHQALDFVLTRPLQDFCGIGPRIAKHLERLGVTSTETLRKMPLNVLRDEFKSYGNFLYAAARGLGDDHVNDANDLPKSIGNSYTFPANLFDEHEIHSNLLALADRVSWRMRQHRVAATHLSVYARYGDFTGTGCGKQERDPFVSGLQLADIAWGLLWPNLDTGRGVRLLGLSASGLQSLTVPLLTADQKLHQALRALDAITEKYGSGTWQRAGTMKTFFKERVSGWHYDHEL